MRSANHIWRIVTKTSLHDLTTLVWFYLLRRAMHRTAGWKLLMDEMSFPPFAKRLKARSTHQEHNLVLAKSMTMREYMKICNWYFLAALEALHYDISLLNEQFPKVKQGAALKRRMAWKFAKRHEWSLTTEEEITQEKLSNNSLYAKLQTICFYRDVGKWNRLKKNKRRDSWWQSVSNYPPQFHLLVSKNNIPYYLLHVFVLSILVKSTFFDRISHLRRFCVLNLNIENLPRNVSRIVSVAVEIRSLRDWDSISRFLTHDFCSTRLYERNEWSILGSYV